jgi:hypothetical protein
MKKFLKRILVRILMLKGVIFTAMIYSEEQKNQAKNVDLIDFLKQTEDFDFRQVGQKFRCVQHNSLVIAEDRKGFFWNSEGINGANVIDWQMKIKGDNFVQAMRKIIGEPNFEHQYNVSKQTENVKKEPFALSEKAEKTSFKLSKKSEKKPFILPEKAESNNRVLAYLIKTRGIDQHIVKALIKEGKIYQDMRNNAVFVGFDNEKKPAYAFKRSTFTLGENSKFRGEEVGSNKGFSFRIDGTKKSKIYCFESPIDCLSKMTLDGIFNPNSSKENTLISLGGVFDNALEKYLETNSQVKEIIFCLDNDIAGRESTQKLSQKYAEKGFDVKCIFPKLKDFNEDLKFYRQQAANADFKAQNAVSEGNNVAQNTVNEENNVAQNNANNQQFSQI